MPEPVITTCLAAAALACAVKQVHQGHKMKKTLQPAQQQHQQQQQPPPPPAPQQQQQQQQQHQLGGASLQYDNATRLVVEETYHKSLFSRHPKLISRKISTDGLGGHVSYQEQSPVASTPTSNALGSTSPGEPAQTHQHWGHAPSHPPSYQSLYDLQPQQYPTIHISNHCQQTQAQSKQASLQLALETPPSLPQRHAASPSSLYALEEAYQEDEDLARAIAASLEDW